MAGSTKELPPLLLQWGLSSYFGWGVYGIHLMLNWLRQGHGRVLSNGFFNREEIVLGPIEQRLIAQSVERSIALRRDMPIDDRLQQAVVLHALGEDLSIGTKSEYRMDVSPLPTFGVAFFSQTTFSSEARARLPRYRVLVAGSSWNRDVLKSAGFGPVECAIQGVDLTAFHPAPRAGWLGQRFAVFSGGKLEHRKGQDLVVRAFRAFAARHPDALLVTAWSSPFHWTAFSLGSDGALAPVPADAAGLPDIPGWTTANGIPPEQTLHLGLVPNLHMPRVLREMDVAVFPNRAEGGTNLVAMECIASGVPTILSNNTGHLDLTDGTNTLMLMRQKLIPGAGTQGWGESDVEEIVEILEDVWRNREAARQAATRGATAMQRFTWSDTTTVMAEIVGRYS